MIDKRGPSDRQWLMWCFVARFLAWLTATICTAAMTVILFVLWVGAALVGGVMLWWVDIVPSWRGINGPVAPWNYFKGAH